MNDGRDVIDLAMLRTAVGAFEYPEDFVLGPDGQKKGARVLHGNLLIVDPVDEQKGALHILDHAVKPE